MVALPCGQISSSPIEDILQWMWDRSRSKTLNELQSRGEQEVQCIARDSGLCQRRSNDALVGRSKNTSVMLARRPRNWGPFRQASSLGGIVHRRFRAGTA